MTRGWNDGVRNGSKRPRWLSLVSGLLVLCLSVNSWAQSGADKAAAEALFNQARSLLDAGKFPQACEKLEASQQLDPGLGTLLHLADCYEKANRLASAWATFEEAASIARTRGENERAQIASVRAAALKPQLIQVIVQVTKPAPGLEVRRNGRVIPPASYDVPVPVDEGAWTISASAPGREPFEASLDVKAGGGAPYVVNIPELALAARPAPSSAPAAPAPASRTPAARDAGSSDSGDGQRTWGLIVGGVGVGAAVVSGVFTALAAKSNTDSKESCDPSDPKVCGVRGKKLRNQALTQASVATVTGVIGTLAIAGGATLYFTASTDSDESAGFGFGLQGEF